MNFISYFTILLIFIGPCFLAYLGWQVEGSNTNLISSFYPSYYILIITHIYLCIKSKKYNKDNKKVTLFLLSLIAYVVFFRLFIGRTPSIMVIFNSISLPILYLTFISYLTKTDHKLKIKKIIITLYVINCFLAIYERGTLQNIFSLSLAYKDVDFSIDNNMYADLFRSTALLGHPLSNALITAIIMSFILISDYKIITKYMLYSIGFFALMCFNARGSIVFSALSFLAYAILSLFDKNVKSSQKTIIIFSFISCILIFIILINQGYAGRFFEKDVSEDGSILARIEVFNILSQCDLTTYLWGTDNIIRLARNTLGHSHIENWLILSILQVGLIITVTAIFIFISLFRKSTKYYKPLDKYLTIGIFLCVASTNNSLACGVPAISTFFICAYAFNKNNRLAH